jgi:two-component system, NarL family, sensor histidine kinase DesK
MAMAAAEKPSRKDRFSWLFAAVWLFYLYDNVQGLLAQHNLWWRDVGFAALAGFAVLYLYLVHLTRLVRRISGRPRSFVIRATIGLVAMLALCALQIPGAGSHALTCLVYIAAFGMVALPLPPAIALAVFLGVAAEVLPATVPGWTDNGYGLAVLLGSLATWGIRLAVIRQSSLLVAEKEIAALAVQNERARIASDLHDILGHSLTVVTLKAELAQRLLDVDLDKARKELAELEVLARDALSDVRATAMGVRGISLPGEIASAREALDAAHVTAVLPGAADDIPTRYRELFAWTIREAVTNVVRHARASQVEVRMNPRSVEIVDDGIGGAAAASADGQGLPGLRRRAEALGGKLTVGCRDDHPGFRVRVEVPS